MKSDDAYNALRDQIVSGALPFGRRLVLKRIAGELGMSTMPVREACLRLERDGLVTFESHKGAVVTSPSLEELLDLTRVVMWNQTLAVLESLPHHDDASLAAADVVLGEERGALDRYDAQEFMNANGRFHVAISVGADPSTLALIDEIRVLTWRGRRTYPARDMMERVHADHIRILDALRRGDRDAVFVEMEAHRVSHVRAWQAAAEQARAADDSPGVAGDGLDERETRRTGD